jgi:hypothetical protein
VPAPDGGDQDPALLSRRFATGHFTAAARPRVATAGLRVEHFGDTTYVLGLGRDELGRTWRSLVASIAGVEAWRVEEGPSERLTDFVVHPSGELTLGLERRDSARDAFDLLRLGSDGGVLARQVLARPTTIPPRDLSPTLPASPFAMRGVLDTSVVPGWLPWLALEAQGEDVVVGLLSYVDLGDAGVMDGDVISAVLALRWDGVHFAERWARVVDDRHALLAVAWEYDDFLWMDAASRLRVRVAPDGRVAVGRTLTNSRCRALVATFRELDDRRCRELLAAGTSHRYQPFAFTRFSDAGVREGTGLLAPAGLEEFVVLDLALRAGQDEVAVVGAAVQLDPDSGTPDYYFEPPGAVGTTFLMPFQGYLAVLDVTTGTPRLEHFVGQSRGDFLAALRWTDEGLLAAGGTDWNRWWGGMSVSRGADPWLALDPLDGGAVLTRRFEVPSLDRHTFLLSVDVRGDRILGVGPHDAPLTHSGDNGATAAKALGGIELELGP